MCRCWGALLTSDRMLWLLVLVTPIRHPLLLFPEKGIPPHQHFGSFSGSYLSTTEGFPGRVETAVLMLQLRAWKQQPHLALGSATGLRTDPKRAVPRSTPAAAEQD